MFGELLEDTGNIGEVLRRDFSKFTAGPSFWLSELGYPPIVEGKKGTVNSANELDYLVDNLSASEAQQGDLQLLQQAQHLFTVEVAATRLLELGRHDLELGRSEVVIHSKPRQLLKEVVDLRNMARDEAQTNITPTMDAWEKLHNYDEHSLIPFVTLLDSAGLDIENLDDRGQLDFFRLRAYQRGEDVLSVEEFAILENMVQEPKKLLSLNQIMRRRDSQLREQDKELIRKNQSYLVRMGDALRVEQDAQVLQERGIETTPVQKQLIARVEQVRNRALVQLKHNLGSHEIKHYQEAQTTAALLFVDILAELNMSVAKIASVSGVSSKVIVEQQTGKMALREGDAELVINALKQALVHLPVPNWWQQMCNSLGKNRTCFAAHKQHLSSLLSDFAAALRVERYLQEAQQATVE